MREPEHKREVLAALDTILPTKVARYIQDSLPYREFKKPYPDSVVASRVRWDYAELYDWLHYLGSSMRDSNSLVITAWGIDATGGRIFFMVETREMLTAMQTWLAGKGIPCRLVVLRVGGRAYPA